MTTSGGDDFANLPRSVRWRIQLGLYVDPSEQDPTASSTLDYVLKWNEDTVQQHNARFQQLMEKYVEEEEEEEQDAAGETGSPNKAENKSTAADIDPLTAMVREQEARDTRKAELYLKYRKERARRKRGLTGEPGSPNSGESDGVDRASLQIIEKDLNRLPHPAGQPASPNNMTPEQEARITSLREILYIYAQEHPGMGYRQGMHEIASYLLFLLELEQPQHPDDPLFNPILPICFALLEKTLDQLQLAYDASGNQSLQQMSHSILSKVHQNDLSLYTHLTTSPNIPPPPIYCTRWVRLLFSREVVGYENVWKLWDVFFEFHVMRALEVTSASRILLLRDALLNPDNNSLDMLMNVPPLTDITPLTNLLRRLMQQKDADEPIQLPPSQILPLPETLERGSSMDHHHKQQLHPLQGYPSNESPNNKNNFSFSKMRSSLNQKGESLRNKIITTTNEWKQASNRETSGGSLSASPGMMEAAGDAIRTHSMRNKPTETILFNDPLLQPPSPRQHQHEMWSQLLKQRIWTIQEFLMATEANGGGSKIPREVWEALADMDRMQQELHNYSVNMRG